MIKLPGEGAWSGVPLEPGVLGVGQPDLADQLFRALQLKGPLPSELDRRYQVGITALDLMEPEYRYLRRETLAYCGGNNPAVAGQFSFQALQGIADAVVVLERFILTNLNAVALTVQLGTMGAAPAAGTITPGVPRDSRLGVAATTGGKLHTGANAAPGLPARVGLVSVPAGGSLQFDEPIVLVGASAFFVCIAQAVNSQLATTFFWRERHLLTSEG